MDLRSSRRLVDTVSLYEPIKEIDGDKTLEDIIPSDFNVENNFIEQEEINALNNAISKLKPRDQLILKYYFYDGVKQKDIAKKLNVGQAYISKQIRIILEKLQKYMSNNDGLKEEGRDASKNV